MTTDQEREAARNFLRKSDGDIGIALANVLARVTALEACASRRTLPSGEREVQVSDQDKIYTRAQWPEVFCTKRKS
jgi:hypothetical protein